LWNHFALVLPDAKIDRLWEDPVAALVVVVKTLEDDMAGHTEMLDGHHRPFNGTRHFRRRQSVARALRWTGRRIARRVRLRRC
jgi:hypothetical protein